MKKINLLLSSYILVIIFLFLYSYTQVDLSLTLSRISIYQTAEKFFQHIGYFQRPLSTWIYIILLILLFVFYGIFIRFADKQKISKKQIWTVVLITGLLLAFSYNAFSYDLFNYIFDAKIITHYHQNPYVHKALEYPKDPMLSFMHSVHRVFPYGPSWIILTVPFSFLGGNIFLITFYLFKIISAFCYLGTVFVIEKLFIYLKRQNTNSALAMFAFNPLVIIEGLVSSHNDIVMAFFAIASIYVILKKKFIVSYFLLIISVGIKYGSVLLLPLFLYFSFLKKLSIQIFLNISFFLMIFSVIFMSFASGQNKNAELQPWYFLNILPFAVFTMNHKIVRILTFFVSFGVLTAYIPFLYNGTWPTNIVSLKIWIICISIILGVIVWALDVSRLKFGRKS